LANLAGAVTVRKLHTTGTASPDELRSLAVEGDYLHAPELAEDRHRARYLSGSEIEIVRDVAHPRITHAIFDHDGTISTLRQGWESVMEPMMLRAVLGRDPDAATADLRQRALTAVRELIDRTTGIQTLAQMQELTGLVRSFEQVPHTAILDCHGYKQIYNEALLERIWARVARLDAGELQPADFIIHGAVELLQQLHDRGIRLYLASGTDQADVIAEATALGYAHLFDGGIHGAVGDLAVEAKRDVMDRIMRDNHISGAELLVIGDGPVEIREGRRRGAICLGIASDEPRRFGVDWAKRARLIRAGADLIVGDFTQRHRLMPALGLA
jgi:phosphoglycolate phosphatase-like HAD superfamily hydrolase